MVIAFSFFIASLIGLGILFTLKAIEEKRERVFAPQLRERADAFARSLRRTAHVLRGEIERIPPALVYAGRFLLHELAIGAAKLARIAETQLKSAADLVSHKRSFEKRPQIREESGSEFLRQVNGVREDKRDAEASSDKDVSRD